jgi:hypothetical protein
MSFDKSQLLTFLAFVLLLCLSACSTENSSMTENETASSTVEIAITITTTPPAASPTIANQVTHPIMGTLIPATQESRLVEALQLEGCELPCYLGITPGKTSWSSAQQILSDLGAEYKGEAYESGTGMLGYAYKILISDTTIVMATPIVNPTHPLDITQSLSFLIGSDSIVQRISVDVGTAIQELKFHNYWSRYSPQQIFIRLGKPDSIYYSPQEGNRMAIIYKSLGVVIKFSGMREGDSVCPNFEINGYTERKFTLTNIASGLSLLPEGERVPFTDREHWLPVAEYLRMSQEELYNQIIADPTICFNVKVVEP